MKIENEFYHNGYKCVVVFSDLGFRCGYVGIPKNHYLYKKSYSNKCLNFSDIKNEELKKRGIIPLLTFQCQEDKSKVSPDLYFNVHGGVTYSGKLSDVLNDDLWYFGFDCGHADDKPDIRSAEEYGMNNEVIGFLYTKTGKVRTQDYVESECRSLAEQLKRVEEGYNNGRKEK